MLRLRIEQAARVDHQIRRDAILQKAAKEGRRQVTPTPHSEVMPTRKKQGGMYFGESTEKL